MSTYETMRDFMQENWYVEGNAIFKKSPGGYPVKVAQFEDDLAAHLCSRAPFMFDALGEVVAHFDMQYRRTHPQPWHVQWSREVLKVIMQTECDPVWDGQRGEWLTTKDEVAWFDHPLNEDHK